VAAELYDELCPISPPGEYIGTHLFRDVSKGGQITFAVSAAIRARRSGA
jgi:hypothetical protein